MNINDEDDDLVDDVVDTEDNESGSNGLDNVQDKLNDVRNIVDKIKNDHGKSGTPEGLNTKSSKKDKGDNGLKENSNGQLQKSENSHSSKQDKQSKESNRKGNITPTNKQKGNTTGENDASRTNTSANNGDSTTVGQGLGNKKAASDAGKGAANSGAATAGGTAAGGAAAGGTAAAAATPAGLVIAVIAIVIIILMIIIGFVSFFTDGLGLIGQKILEFANGIWTAIASDFVGKSELQVKEENIIEIGTYLENMGYDLEGFGFLDSNGKGVTKEDELEDDGTGSGTKTGTRTIKNSDGKVILKRNITQSNGGEIKEGEITAISSDCIWEYLVAENKTYILKNPHVTFFGLIIPGKNVFQMSDLLFGNHMDDGMINIVTDGIFGIETQSRGPWSKANNIAIDRTNKQMVVTIAHFPWFWIKDKYAYSLDGWTGKYGKSLDFLLTLHLATMSPDFAKEVASNEEFNAQVNVKVKKIDASIRLITEDGTEITEDNYEELGFTKEQWKEIEKYNGEIETYEPYISEVTNHWFYDTIDFEDAYVEVENPYYNKNNPQDYTENKEFTYEYKYVGLGEDDDILANLDNLYVREIRSKGIKQVAEPVVTKREYTKGELSLQTMLLGGDPGSENTEEKYKYYIYNGSSVPEGTEREKRYIMQKVQNGENTEYAIDTRFFQYAFAILESTHTLDSEYVLRDLKELFASLGVDISSIEVPKDIGELEWILPDFTPVNWDPMFNTTETEIKISAKKDNSSGFEKDLDVVMPADGKIVKISEDDDGTKTLKIEFTGTDNSKLEGITIFIRGIQSDVAVNDIYERGNKIGTTYNKDITVIMTDRNHTVITNVDNYLYPPKEN